MVVVEVQVLQVRTDYGDRTDLVVGQLQVQQGGYIEHTLGKSFVAQLIAVQSHEWQMIHVFEVVPEKWIKKQWMEIQVIKASQRSRLSSGYSETYPCTTKFQSIILRTALFKCYVLNSCQSSVYAGEASLLLHATDFTPQAPHRCWRKRREAKTMLMWSPSSHCHQSSRGKIINGRVVKTGLRQTAPYQQCVQRILASECHLCRSCRGKAGWGRWVVREASFSGCCEPDWAARGSSGPWTCWLPGQCQPAERHRPMIKFKAAHTSYPENRRGSKGLYLVVIQIQQSQVSHLAEGACRDLGDPVPTETELFKTGRQTWRNLFQLVVLCI